MKMAVAILLFLVPVVSYSDDIERPFPINRSPDGKQSHYKTVERANWEHNYAVESSICASKAMHILGQLESIIKNDLSTEASSKPVFLEAQLSKLDAGAVDVQAFETLAFQAALTGYTQLDSYLSANYDMRPLTNFRALFSIQERFFGKVVEAIGAQFDATSRDELIAKIKELDQKNEKLIEVLNRQTVVDSGALQLLSLTSSKLRMLKGDFDNYYDYVLSPYCLYQPFTKYVTPAREAVDEWIAEFETLEHHVNAEQTMRSRIVDMIHSSTRLYLQVLWAASANEDISTLRQELKKVMALDLLSHELNQWWNNIASGGITGGLHTQFLQYEASLSRLKMYRGKLDQFRRRMEALSIPSAQTQTFLKDRLKLIETEISSAEMSVRQQGWKGMHKRQRFLNEKRLNVIDQFVPQCKFAIAAYQALDSDSIDEDGYKYLEAQYRTVVAACKGAQQ